VKSSDSEETSSTHTTKQTTRCCTVAEGNRIDTATTERHEADGDGGGRSPPRPQTTRQETIP